MIMHNVAKPVRVQHKGKISLLTILAGLAKIYGKGECKQEEYKAL